MEIPQKLKFFLAKDETSQRLECKYAVRTDVDQTQTNFPLYLDCQNRSTPLRKLYIQTDTIFIMDQKQKPVEQKLIKNKNLSNKKCLEQIYSL